MFYSILGTLLLGFVLFVVLCGLIAALAEKEYKGLAVAAALFLIIAALSFYSGRNTVRHFMAKPVQVELNASSVNLHQGTTYIEHARVPYRYYLITTEEYPDYPLKVNNLEAIDWVDEDTFRIKLYIHDDRIMRYDF